MQEPRVVEAILSRYRNFIILAFVVVAQLLLLAWQVRTKQDVRLIRVWAVTTVTPMAGIVEAVRRNTIGFLEDYFILLDVREQNRKLRDENSKLKMDNVYYRNQLTTAERAEALSAFQTQTPSRTVAARVIGNGTAASAQVVFIDRGSTSGVETGMAVVTPDGIVGKIIAVYPLASQVLLVTDPTFAVGVESQKEHIHGTLQCNGSNCQVKYIQNEEKVDRGEWFYTSGEDRIFPKGFPVGKVAATRFGTGMREINLNLSGAPGGADEVLVVIEGAHQQIPTTPPQQRLAKMLPLPPSDAPADQQAPKMATQADKIKQRYEDIGKEQGHRYGAIGSNLPNFNAAAPPQSEPAGSSNAAKDQAKDKTQDQAGVQANSGAAQPAAPPKAERPASSGPQILGARPQQRQQPAPQNPVVQKPKPAVEGPILPLGAPRKKPAAPPSSGPATPATMTEYDQLLKKPEENWFSRFQVLALLAITLIAIIAQFYIPRLIPNTEFLEIPLLLTIYFGLMRHNQLSALFFGAFVGLAQDSLSHLPLGMYGICENAGRLFRGVCEHQI